MKYLIDNAAGCWRFWSVRLAAIAGIAAAYLAANPEQTEDLLALLPDGPLRTLASIAVGLLVFGLATGARIARQPEKGGSDA